MENIIQTLIASAFTLGLILGAGKSLVWLHDEIKKEALTQISKGLSSSKKLSEALTEDK